MKTVLLLSAFTLFAAACGDNGDTTGVDAGVVEPDAYTPTPTAVVVAGDFDVTGTASKLDINSLTVTANVATAGAVAGDPVIRQIGNRIYVVNRLGGNNVTMLDAKTLAFQEQYSTGENSNPQDVAVVGNDLYLPALGTAGLVKVSILDGSTEVIDLGTDLGDAEPDCVSAYAIDNRVFVACGLLDNFVPSGNGKIAVYNTSTGAITVVELPYPNPQNFFARAPMDSTLLGDLLIPLAPSFTNYATGCVARVSTGSTPTAQCVEGLTNALVGGYQTHLDISSDGKLLWMAVGTLDDTFSNPTGALKGYDLATGELWTEAVTPPTQLIVDFAACPDGSVIVIDRTMNAQGMRVYSNNTERTTAALPIGVPPGFGNNTVCYDAGRP